MDIIPVLNQMLVLFMLLAVGYIAGKVNIMTPEACKLLTRLILNITLPCMIISSVAGTDNGLTGTELLTIFALGFFVYIIYAVWAFIIPAVLRVPKPQVGVYRFMSMFSNSAFMGFPVVAAILGPQAVFYASVYNIPFHLFAFSLGVFFITGKGSFSFKHLLSPAVLASVAAVALFLTGIELPSFAGSALNTMGAITTPGSMLVIGGTLAAMPVRDIFSDWRVYAMSVFRLIIIPLSVWFILRFFVTNQMILGICVIIAAMPAAANTTMLCTQYDRDSALASRSVFITTVLSIVTVPLMAWLLF